MAIFDALRDAWDIARHARGPAELARAVVPGLAGPVVLNDGEAAPIEAAALIRGLRAARGALEAHVADGAVDYAALRASDAFAALARLAPALAHLSADDLPRDADRVAFFVNLYNVLAVHGVLALDIRRSVMEEPSFFGRVSYRVGEAPLSLDAMENGVLRRNAPHPATRRPVLDPAHPGLAFAPRAVDPRIHAVLVCASTSCPPIGFYDPEALDGQLDLACAGWVNAEVTVTEAAVELPLIFRWYAADFGGRAGVEAFLRRHADPPLEAALEEAFASGRPWVFRRYDWGLNDARGPA